MATIYCNRCGTPNVGDAAFCSKCGSALARTTEPTTPASDAVSASSPEVAPTASPPLPRVAPTSPLRNRRAFILAGALVVILVTGVFIVRSVTDIGTMSSSGHDPVGRQGDQVGGELQDLRQQVTDETATRERHEAADRLARARADAPNQVTVEQMGCYCAAGRRIIVSCRLSSAAQVPVSIEIAASAQTGFLGVSSKGIKTVTLGARKTVAEQVETKFNGLADCSSAAGCSCTASTVTAE